MSVVASTISWHLLLCQARLAAQIGRGNDELRVKDCRASSALFLVALLQNKEGERKQNCFGLQMEVRGQLLSLGSPELERAAGLHV
jgi:hypothetical protein